jgi:membrane-bound acyltransferase YfiQ involved in biofilm formation
VIITLLKNRIDLSKREFSFPTLISLGIIPTISLPILNTFNGTKSIGMYIALFLLGYYVLSNDNVMEKLEKNKITLGILTSIFTIIYILEIIFLNDNSFTSLTSHYEAFFGWIWILFLLTIGKIYLNKINTIIQYLSEASFTIYIFHESILIAIAFYILQITSNIPMQMLLILLFTLTISFIAYEICKRFKLTRFLFGIK